MRPQNELCCLPLGAARALSLSLAQFPLLPSHFPACRDARGDQEDSSALTSAGLQTSDRVSHDGGRALETVSGSCLEKSRLD